MSKVALARRLTEDRGMNLPSKLVLTIHLALFCVVAIAAAPEKADSQEDESANRITDNLVAFYDFASDSGPIVHDRSGNGVPINLEIEDMAAVRRKEGSLTVRGKTLIASSKAPSRLSAAIKKSCLLYTSPSPRDQRGSRMPSSA